MNTTILKFAAVAFLVAGLVVAFRFGDDSPAERDQPSVGNVQTLRAAYDRWKAMYTRNEGDRKLSLALGYSKGLSAQFTKAHGQATLDLVDGSLSVEVSGLSEREAFDVWLVDNRPSPGSSVKPEPGDGMMRAGSLKHEGGTATLQARLGREALAGFEMDLLVVARAGEAPGAAGLLFASPSLFQRFYYSEQQKQVAGLGEAATRSLLAAPFQVLVPRPAFAQTAGTAALDAALVARGEDLFFNETFNGNGRTCGTCHPAENNLTIDPAFIAKLPPTDPLFVAEQNRKFPGLAKNFENPRLMRQFGLILENVDGFENPGVMRGVPHVLAMSTSMTPAVVPGFGIADGSTIPPTQRTGWSGDGAPGDGTLREFAIGAVKQHFTRTLNRLEGRDFRLPTDEELNAMEAFQLSTGRQADPDLSTLTLKGAVPERGRALFLDEAKCSQCHGNAGASVLIGPDALNFNFDSGVENFPHPARAVVSFPRDGGFGRTPNNGRFGNGTFNTPPLVEAADTGPFFHNNAVQTIEEAVEFYTSEAFSTSDAAVGVPFGVGVINLQPEELGAVAAFLRVLNALENIRSSTEVLQRAQGPLSRAKARELLRLSTAEIDDAIRVLRERGLHQDGVTYLRIARLYVDTASQIAVRQIRNIYIGLAIRFQEIARQTMVVQG
jgi:cytochrome c peroxidase